MRDFVRQVLLAVLVACAAQGAYALDAVGAKQVIDKLLGRRCR